MATTTSITTTYAGEFSGKYIAAALLSAPTLEKGGMTIMPNVKYKQVIKRVATDDIIKNATCDYDPTSTITLTEKVLQPEAFQVNLTLCKSDFRSDWDAIQMGYSAFDVLPKSFADFLIAHAAEKVAAGMETSIWQGVNATAGQFAGIMTQLTTDAALPAAQEVAGTTVDASNVITELGKIIDAAPAALYGKEDLTLYVS
jgi:5-enolpyruvylshikimate-3-phosphate synthase